MAMAMNLANKSSQFCCDLASIPAGKSCGMIKSRSRENAATNKPNRVFAGPRNGTERNGQRRAFSSRVAATMGSVIDALLGSNQTRRTHHDESDHQSEDRDPRDRGKDFLDVSREQARNDGVGVKLLGKAAGYSDHESAGHHAFELAHAAQDDHHKSFHNEILTHVGNDVAIHAAENTTGHASESCPEGKGQAVHPTGSNAQRRGHTTILR